MDTQPTIKNLNQLDTAVLLEKYIILNGLLHYGSSKQKLLAKEELATMQKEIMEQVNLPSIAKAMVELGVDIKQMKENTDFLLK